MSNPFSTAVARALQPSNESLIKILALITSAVTPDGKLRVSLPGLNKSSTGLGNVDNTSDVNKPVSTAQADAIALKQDTLPTGAALQVLRRNATNTALEFTNTTNVAGPIIDTPPESPSILNDEFDNLSTLPGGSSPKWTQEPGPLGGSNSNAVRDIVGGTWLRHRNMVAPLITAPSQWKFNHVATLPGESWVVRGRFMIQLGPNFVDSSNYIHLAVLSGGTRLW